VKTPGGRNTKEKIKIISIFLKKHIISIFLKKHVDNNFYILYYIEVFKKQEYKKIKKRL
jgi:hypothetical protein